MTRGFLAGESFQPETPTAHVDTNTSPDERTSFAYGTESREDTRRPRKPPDPSGGLTSCAGLQTRLPTAPTLSHGRGHLWGALAGYSNRAGVAVANVWHLLLMKELGFFPLSSEPVAHQQRRRPAARARAEEEAGPKPRRRGEGSR